MLDLRIMPLLLLLSGCAYSTAVPVPYNDDDPKAERSGFRVYAPKPILIVNGTEAKISWVPNYEKGYAVRFGAFLSKNNIKMQLTNGVLTNFESNMDSTQFLTFFQNVVEKALETGEGLFSAFSTQGSPGGKIGVYEFVFDDDGKLTELRPLLQDTTPVASDGAVDPTVGAGGQ
jgi:hypothetical protein